MSYAMRAETCPHCGGGVEVVDKPIYVAEQSQPVAGQSSRRTAPLAVARWSKAMYLNAKPERPLRFCALGR